jgi:hypothetical protein
MDFLKKLLGISKQQSKPSVTHTDRSAAPVHTATATSSGTLTVADIMRLKREKDIQALIRSLQYRGDTAVRAEAALQAVTPLISVLQGDSDPYVRSIAARALGNLGDARARDALMYCLENDMHQVSLDAIEALSKIH